MMGAAGNPVVGGSSPVVGSSPPVSNALQGGDFLGTIFNALFDPKTAARQMAETGMTPEDFAANMSNQHLSHIMQQQAQAKAVGSNDVFMPNGTRIIQPGPDHPDIFPATGDEFVGAGQLGKLMNAGLGKNRTDQDAINNARDPLGTFSATPMGNEGVVPPIVPPTVPPMQGENVPPIAPPVVPPSASGAPTIPGKILEGVMTGNEAGANANFKMPNRYFTPTPAKALPSTANIVKGEDQRNIYGRFMGTIKAGLKNPNALAAVASTGMRESGYKPGNVYGTWDDLGAPSGGTMSWRAERLANLKKFAGKDSLGDIDPETQAKFFLQENPDLIAKLEAAKTPEEAQTLMNNAWRFKGYNQPGGEAGARIELAKKFAGDFASGNDGSTIGGAGDGGRTAANAATPGATGNNATSLTERLAGLGDALKMPDGSAGTGAPNPPSAVPPRPGEYDPSQQVMRTILAMLAPMQQQPIPSLAQLMG